MDWDKLDKKITNSPRYRFFQKHERLIVFIQGICVILLLVAIITFYFHDKEIKEQIRDRCGYTKDKWECVCEKNFVEAWKEYQKGSYDINLNLSAIENVQVDK